MMEEVGIPLMGGRIPASRLIKMFKSKKMDIIYIVLTVIIIIIGIILWSGKMRTGAVLFKDRTEQLVAKVEIAENLSQWAKGLMFRKSLDQDKGMLFIFSDEVQRTFWMKNVNFPLDLIFISQDSKIVELKENFMPCQSGEKCESYKSENPAKYVLEVNGGFVNKNNILIGESLNIEIVSK